MASESLSQGAHPRMKTASKVARPTVAFVVVLFAWGCFGLPFPAPFLALGFTGEDAAKKDGPADQSKTDTKKDDKPKDAKEDTKKEDNKEDNKDDAKKPVRNPLTELIKRSLGGKQPPGEAAGVPLPQAAE